MMAVNLGTRGVAARPSTSSSTATTRRAPRCPTCAARTAPRSRTASGSGASATRWTARGRSATRPPHEYGRLAAETARAMRLVDPASSWSPAAAPTRSMPTFARVGGDRAGARATTTSTTSRCTTTTTRTTATAASFLATAVDLDRAIDDVVATADHVGARLRHATPAPALVRRVERLVPVPLRRPSGPPEWAEAPALIEDTYDVTDAVVVGSLLITLLRHADRVGIACQAQLVNVIAPIRTEPPAARPGGRRIFHPFAQAARATPAATCCGSSPAVATYDDRPLRRRPAARRHRHARRGDRRASRSSRSTARTDDDLDARRATCARFRGHRVATATTLDAPTTRAPSTPRTRPTASCPRRQPARSTGRPAARRPARRLLERRPARAAAAPVAPTRPE